MQKVLFKIWTVSISLENNHCTMSATINIAYIDVFASMCANICISTNVYKHNIYVWMCMYMDVCFEVALLKE